jgi:hypothetical protein
MSSNKIETTTPGFAFSYTDPSGQYLPNAWFVIQTALAAEATTTLPSTLVVISYNIYVDINAFLNNNPPFRENSQARCNTNNPDWVNFFDENTMKTNDLTFLETSYNFLFAIISTGNSK